MLSVKFHLRCGAGLLSEPLARIGARYILVEIMMCYIKCSLAKLNSGFNKFAVLLVWMLAVRTLKRPESIFLWTQNSSSDATA